MVSDKRRAVFFDRDGVILKPVMMDGRPRSPHSIAEYEALSGRLTHAKEAVEQAKQAGFLALLISNQPDVAYGNISKAEWQWIQDQLTDIPFDDVFICFHRRDDNCDCMKPKPGKLLEAAKKWSIDLPRSFVVGDTKDDVGVAASAGCKSVLIDAPYNASVQGDIRIHSLDELPRVIL